MSVERFWLWGEVMRRVAQMAEDENSEHDPIGNKLLGTYVSFQFQNARINGPRHTSSCLLLSLRVLLVAPYMLRNCGRKSRKRRRIGRGNVKGWLHVSLRGECSENVFSIHLTVLIRSDRNWKTFTIFLDALFHFLPNAGDAPDVESYPCRLKKAPSEVAKQEATPTEGTEEKTEAPTAEDEQATTEKLPLTVENVRAFFKELADADEAIQAARERASHLAVLELERRLRKYPNLIGGELSVQMSYFVI